MPMEERFMEETPTKNDLIKSYTVSIRFLDRGCIVNVGCKEIAFEDIELAMKEVNEYVLGDTSNQFNKWRKILRL